MTKTEYCVSTENVMALLDGELSAADARTISAHVEECSECALVAEQLRGVSETLSEWRVPEVPMAVEEFVEERLEKMSSRHRMMRARFSPRKLFAVGGAGAASLLMLWLIAVLARSHEQRVALIARPPAMTYEAVRPPELTYRIPALEAHEAPPQGGIVAGIAGMADASTLARNRIAGQLQRGTLGALETAPMIARTMSLTVLVKDVEAARGSLDSILARNHGYSARLNMSSPEGGARSVSASLRVPSSDLDSAAQQIKALGRVVTESQSGEEVTQQHADLVARLKTARETEARFQAILAERTGKIADVLEVEQNIARVRGEIESMEAEQTALEHRVDFATVDVQFVEEYKAPLAPPAANSATTRLHNAFVAGYHNAAETLLGIVLFAEEYAPPILIWLAILGLPVVAIWRRYKRARVRVERR